MTKIPFTVSARAAILIGRENIANSKGAIIELVKNCYDADSPFCIVKIDNEFAEVPKYLAIEKQDKLIKKGISWNYIKRLYALNSGRYELVNSPRQLIFKAFEKRLRDLVVLYIIDAGDGMTKEIIQKHWMTIGTDNKLQDYMTNSKRVKSGAKGIGRFALDKLGRECRMVTIADPEVYSNLSESDDGIGAVWHVNWADFEKKNITISQVEANLEIIQSGGLMENSNAVDPSFDLVNIAKIVRERSSSEINGLQPSMLNETFSHGTILKISKLHDVWNDNLVKQIFTDLEVLVPPRDTEEFSIHMISRLKPNDYGEVLSSVCDDFDYKLTAKADSDQNVVITIEREEYDTSIIPHDFFERDMVKNSNFANRSVFLTKKYIQHLTFSQLIPSNHDNSLLSEIGPFEFIFYFLKKTTTSVDSARFFYKPITSHTRKEWLDKLGGIKIYRDNFRVRPYGEVNEPAFDWLGLGSRKAASPAGIGKPEGGYRVELENIAGVIKISRLTNLEFVDKSSREGLQETQAFQLLKQIITAVIAKFEEDRSFMARELSKYDNEKFGAEKDLEKADKLAQSILERDRQKNKTNHASSANSNKSDGSPANDEKKSIENQEAVALAHLAESRKETIEKLTSEHKLLRGLASSGILSAALGHDLSKIQGKLQSRSDKLINLLSLKVTKENFDGVEDYENPFVYIDQMKKSDRKISTWLGFSLGFTRKDKRKRKQLFLETYFQQLRSSWFSTLSERGIEFSIDCATNIELRAFEIDFDSVFVNFLTNSLDAFTRPSTKQVPRRIWIKCEEIGNQILIEYRDNGPGISQDILDPEVIFDPMYTTKRDHTGQETGTGLGMWIVRTVVNEYEGNVKLLFNADNDQESGFGLRISIPSKYKVKEATNGL
ncbi:HAMP domain-containing sensor histidine kinase [Methylobacter sp. G7]|uniref:sensor histidine kinase n=1 Tax=Methylobacter sp. G7 TaxID=3230117 RepID=UPI003D806ED6